MPSATTSCAEPTTLCQQREPKQHVLTNLAINTCELLTPPTRSAREIAELVHASPRTIERASVTETGETFQERRRQARMTKAKQLFIDGRPLDAIALHVGYSTASAFGRAFKKRTGLSPCAYFNEYVSAGVRI